MGSGGKGGLTGKTEAACDFCGRAFQQIWEGWWVLWKDWELLLSVIPCFWCFKNFQLIQLSNDSEEYGKIKRLFEKTMKNYCINQLQRIQNPTLWDIFQWFVSILFHYPCCMRRLVFSDLLSSVVYVWSCPYSAAQRRWGCHVSLCPGLAGGPDLWLPQNLAPRPATLLVGCPALQWLVITCWHKPSLAAVAGAVDIWPIRLKVLLQLLHPDPRAYACTQIGRWSITKVRIRKGV